MNQNEKLMRVQLLNQYSESYIAADTSFAGENLPLVWQKSIEEPENLTLAEMRILESQTFAPLLRWLNLYNLAQSGILDESVWKKEVSIDVSFYFGTPYGSAWWKNYTGKKGMDAQFLPEAVKEESNKHFINSKDYNITDTYRDIQKIIKKNIPQEPLER